VIARELGRSGIRVNCIAPGHIWGPPLQTYFEWLAGERAVSPDEVFEEVAGATALHHIPTPDEIAGAAVFFASRLSGAVTGQTLDVNAGRTFD
jgi:NAD(P)-dependent dehydrogenase (short-subunit alcohol dehydrogenase family)